MAEINFELYNNQLVQQLVGPQDANLKLIEQLLNVTIGSFGNQITIQGNGETVEQARTAIDMLYNKLSRGIDITEQEVKAAVRMSDEGAEKITEQNLDDIVLKPKTPYLSALGNTGKIHSGNDEERTRLRPRARRYR